MHRKCVHTIMGKVYIFMGDGAGKTTGALGLAMRSIGHNRNVVMIQFMKWWKNTGEYKIQKKLGKYYKVYQFGRPVWLKITKGKTEFGGKKFKVEEKKEIDRQYALSGLKKTEEVMKKEKPDLLILDEIGLAAYDKLLEVKEILELLKKIPKRTTVILTGRKMPKELVKRADFVNETRAVKYPKNNPAEKGIQY